MCAGAGVVGSSAALALVKRGLRVLLLEQVCWRDARPPKNDGRIVR